MIRKSPALVLLVTVAVAQNGAAPQPDRSAYEAAYRAWRAADPDLERDTATASPAMSPRADKVSVEAAKYYAARKAHLDKLQADLEGVSASIEPVPALLALDNKPSAYVANQTRLLSGNIDSMSGDRDPAIQRLRAALDRERLALTALASSLADTQRGYDQAQMAAMTAEQARGKVTADYQSLAASLKQSGTDAEQSANLWAEYYRALSEGVRNAPPMSASPQPNPVPDTQVASLPSNPPPDSGPNTPPAARGRTLTPIPLSRYTGAWIYPTIGAEFHGTEPASVDMLIRETNGQAKGTMIVWFKVAPNSKVEPAVRFDFSGPFQNARNQSFPLITSNGAAGTLELIPGNVYNMIHVRFTTQDKPETIRQADFLLIKK